MRKPKVGDYWKYCNQKDGFKGFIDYIARKNGDDTYVITTVWVGTPTETVECEEDEVVDLAYFLGNPMLNNTFRLLTPIELIILYSKEVEVLAKKIKEKYASIS